MQPLEWFSLQKEIGLPFASATNLPAAKHWRYASAPSRAYFSPPALRKSAINSASNFSQRFLSASYSAADFFNKAAASSPLRRQYGRRFVFMYWIENSSS